MSPQFPHDLREVFSKAKATSRLPNCPYVCNIVTLLPGASPPKGRLYSFLSPETLAMREYIQSSLKAGIIRPSSSPTGVGFFFVDKRDKPLWPCIYCRGLNNITVKNRYPLPLISAVFERLQQVKIFTNRDLWNAYNFVKKNLKPDVLFRMFSLETTSQEPDYILSRRYILEAIGWEVEEQVLQAQNQDTIP